jgi:hypothetical protein
MFREICGVPKNTPWPPPDEVRVVEGTNEEYYTPDFSKDVSYSTNTMIFRKIQSLITQEFKVSSVSLLMTISHQFKRITLKVFPPPSNIIQFISTEKQYLNLPRIPFAVLSPMPALK